MSFDFGKWTIQRAKDVYESEQMELQSVLDQQDEPLGSKLEKLYQHQNLSGFILDDFSQVNRFSIYENNGKILPLGGYPRYFIAQYNPRRAERSRGAGRSSPPPGVSAINGGCFLCQENIWWQHRGLEKGYRFLIDERPYRAWCNPFPIMPYHLVVASEVHESQKWIEAGVETGEYPRARRIVNDLLRIASMTPDFISFYNGIGAGASIPTHLHFQVFKRPDGHMIYPLEMAAKAMRKEHEPPFIVEDYPITCLYFRGYREELCDQVVKCLSRWSKACNNSINLSANIIAVRDKKGEDKNIYHLFLVPRDALFALSVGRKGVVGGLEVMGEIVFSEQEEFSRMQSGLISFDSIYHILRSVEAQTISGHLRQISKTLAI
jgi:hypothetical protein